MLEWNGFIVISNRNSINIEICEKLNSSLPYNHYYICYTHTPTYTHTHTMCGTYTQYIQLTNFVQLLTGTNQTKFLLSLYVNCKRSIVIFLRMKHEKLYEILLLCKCQIILYFLFEKINKIMTFKLTSYIHTKPSILMDNEHRREKKHTSIPQFPRL